jgi:hypothetical protein
VACSMCCSMCCQIVMISVRVQTWWLSLTEFIRGAKSGRYSHLNPCSARCNKKRLYTSKLPDSNMPWLILPTADYALFRSGNNNVSNWLLWINIYWLFFNHMCNLYYFLRHFLSLKKSFPQSYPQKMWATWVFFQLLGAYVYYV